MEARDVRNVKSFLPQFRFHFTVSYCRFPGTVLSFLLSSRDVKDEVGLGKSAEVFVLLNSKQELEVCSRRGMGKDGKLICFVEWN